MDGRRSFSFRKLAHLVVAVPLLVTACDRPDSKPDPTPDAAVEPRHPAVEGINLAELVETAQATRDREFERPPAIAPVTEPFRREPPDAVRADRDAILYGLFGRTEPWRPVTVPEREIAWWDAGEGVVKLRTDVKVDDAERERAVLFALLRGLDARHSPESGAPTSWDAYLAAEAVRLGPAYFALTHVLADERRDDVTLDDIATYPGVVGELPIGASMIAADGGIEERAAAFGPRQGHGLAAAMFRASGWSGVEMLWHDRPTSTAWIVRPDRWLSGDGIGDWQWPKIPTQIRETAGWKLDQQGRVGPAITAIFLSTAVAPASARTVYVTWQSDSYRSWRKGDNWLFEWVTIWDTPTAAEEFVVAAQEAFRKQGREGRFSVMRRGTTVALLGSDDPDEDLDRHATSVVTMRPKFQPRDKGMLSFVPTPPDVAADAVHEAKLDDGTWSDPYTGVKIDISPVEDWDLRRAEGLTIRWFARQDGALIQFSTDFPIPLAPNISDDAWKDWVIDGFKRTVKDLTVVRAERGKVAGQEGWYFEFTGSIEGRPSRVLVRQTMSTGDRGSDTPRVLVLSLQEPRGETESPEKSAGEKAFEAIAVTVKEPWQPEAKASGEPKAGGLLPRND